ncbi:methylmalonyl Co-A mutase-associated GTPase MeaB [Candidatus Geothermarchaeota archaeon ex4572_27]|nr:MAG: methylmalonyl Co-A mutase-associated GTPase MeaB [Candidatus Geothermarchaeota archaeon ex4572_27]
MSTGIEELVSSAIGGDRRSLGRLLSYLEGDPAKASQILSSVLGRAGKAHVIGVTGIPGSGKSTLISRLIAAYRRKGHRVAVIAIDPTSPYSHGALLGDRLRMQEHATDPGVFIRSVSTRGLKGGLSLAALGMIEVFDAAGYDKIFVESVGVGQAEVDIMHTAHTLLVVTMPGVGDEIQALKAGVMEIGDIYVLNKCDKPEASKTYEYLSFAIRTGELRSRGGWTPKIIRTAATLGQGINDLVTSIDEHYRYIVEGGLYTDKVSVRRRFILKILAEKIFLDALNEAYAKGEIPAIAESTDMYREAIEIIRKIVGRVCSA